MSRILLVDDEPNTIQGLKRMLYENRPDWDIVTAATARAARDIVTDGCVDVVVSDIRMPGTTGIDLLRDLKSSPHSEHIPVLMLSGHDDGMAKYEALRLGALDFIRKPAEPHELVARIDSAFRLKNYEDRLRQQNVILERQLIQSQKMELVGLLASGIVHDLNNILGSIIGHTELAAHRTGGDGNVQEPLRCALESADHATRLVRQILMLGRASEDTRGAYDLGTVIDEGMKLLSVTIPPGIRVEWRKPDMPMTVELDSTQMHQVLMNLCTNAVHAMNGHGVLTVTLTKPDSGSPDAAAGFARLRVSDTGTGMNEDTRKRIFDHFFTTKEAGEGTGVGLSVVQRIVHNHGGTITVDSTPGAGTVFSVNLPFSGTAQEPIQQAKGSVNNVRPQTHPVC